MTANNGLETLELVGNLELASEGPTAECWHFREAAGYYYAPIDSRPFIERNVYDLFNPLIRGHITHVGDQLSVEDLAGFAPSEQDSWWVSVQWDEYPDENRRHSDLPSCHLLTEEFDDGYEYIIRSGDKLTVLSPGRSPRVVMNRKVDLQPYSPHQVPRDQYHPYGQDGVDRDEWADWFSQRFPAQLVTKRPKGRHELDSTL